jgi:hypothetical protein
MDTESSQHAAEAVDQKPALDDDVAFYTGILPPKQEPAHPPPLPPLPPPPPPGRSLDDDGRFAMLVWLLLLLYSDYKAVSLAPICSIVWLQASGVTLECILNE